MEEYVIGCVNGGQTKKLYTERSRADSSNETRKLYLGTNLKMYKTTRETSDYLRSLVS